MKIVLTAILMSAWSVAATAATALTLEKIMADPDWIGPPVRDAYWAVGGEAVYYSLKQVGSPIVDLHKINLSRRKDVVIEGAAMALADAAPVFDRAGKRAAFVRHRDVFVRELASGKLTQITRSPQNKRSPRFSLDGQLLSFRVDNEWFVHDFGSGVTTPAAIVKADKDPNAAAAPDDLRELQLHVFSTLKKQHDDKDLLKVHDEALQKADPTRVAAEFYLGTDVTVLDTELSPDARWLMVITQPKPFAKGMEGKLTRYVTESGYEEFETERLRVGRNPPPPQSLLLLNLIDHTIHPLSIDKLPGIFDDPLKSIREENAKAHATQETAPVNASSKPRAIWVANDDPDDASAGVVWSDDSQALAVEMFSIDNKDRWIASVDLQRYELVAQHRLSDAAWVDPGPFSAMGWLNDNRTLWYLSEESGYSQLYSKTLSGASRPLTQGQFEISAPQLSADGQWFYVLSNAEAPYAYDVYRVPSAGGALTRVTRLQGVENFVLDRPGKRLLLTHSTPYVRAQIAVARADGKDEPQELTDTRTGDYKAMSWITPEIVRIPSSHGAGEIYAKLYRDPSVTAAKHPAVLFVHGAGYLQDVHLHYSYYFREQMFHNLLAHRGYVVLDMDYRASAGYGRNWRTAIYRQMGHPELEDLLDGKQWLEEHAAVDPQRVGIYGGSYGGFMTLMALFRAPGEFAAGAALRPVTDWTQYNHGYTSAILNDPQVDPIAYARSSPIEFAAGLADPLLICHGVIDDNVLFEDSMRLYERLIELHKDNFTLSPYPLDRHSFSNADSWLDEYKRIFQLFEAHLSVH